MLNTTLREFLCSAESIETFLGQLINNCFTVLSLVEMLYGGRLSSDISIFNESVAALHFPCDSIASTASRTAFLMLGRPTSAEADW